MKALACCFCSLMLFLSLEAQEIPNNFTEQQLENLAEAEEAATEDDSYYQGLVDYRKKPLDLNAATRSDLAVFRWLSDIQVENLLRYRQLLGPLISLFELQAIPAWDIETIRRLQPYVMVGDGKKLVERFGERFRHGDQSILLRAAQVMEKSRGYIARDSLGPAYQGNRQRLLVRYRYQFRNLLQFGVLAEKDPGEPMFRGAQRLGFDFYSAHLFARNLGRIRMLAIGDFTVNMGQGLLTYQSLAFRKSADVTNVKRQTDLFRPYNSPGENNFHRGVAVSTQWGRWQVGAFVSRQRRSANLTSDTLDDGTVVSSLNRSGLHRTSSEMEDKGAVLETGVGASLHYVNRGLKLGVNSVHYRYSKSFQRDDRPYNYFQFGGDRLTAFSLDMAYTWRNAHLFGEFAANPGGGKAMVAGMLLSLDRYVDLTLLTRQVQRNYHTIYGNIFAESSTANNEKGFYAGLTLRLSPKVRVDMYADYYSFPWLRFRVSRPSWGTDYMVQMSWRPNKLTEAYLRFRFEEKAIDASGNLLTHPQTENIPRQNLRMHLSHKLSNALTIRCRTEMMWWNRGATTAEEGFLLYIDGTYRPWQRPWGIGARLAMFDTDGFNSRIYAYENDVLYSFSIPAFSGTGYRYYINAQYDITRSVTAYLRLAQVNLPDETSLGSGNDEIAGNKRTDWRVQVIWNF